LENNDSNEKKPEEDQHQHKKSIKSNIGKALIRSGLDAVSKVIEIVKRELN